LIGPEKIAVLYVIGISLSVLLPTVLTLGAVRFEDLQTFPNLPPVLDNVIQLVFDLVIVVLQAGCIYVVLRAYGRKGSFGKLILGLVFVAAFYQLVDRPLGYLRGKYIA